MNAFIYNDMHVKEGNITAPWDKDEWKEGLKYLNKLYKEGLIYSGSFTQDADQNKTLGDNPDVPILGASVGLNSGSFADLENGRGRDFEVVPPLKGPDGEQVTLYTPSPVTKPTEFIITKNAKHPDVAMRWADAMYSEEITMRSTLGPPDEGWKEAEEGEKGLDGANKRSLRKFKLIGLHKILIGPRPGHHYDPMIIEQVLLMIKQRMGITRKCCYGMRQKNMSLIFQQLLSRYPIYSLLKNKLVNW